jgi:thiamine pyrophosphokinase
MKRAFIIANGKMEAPPDIIKEIRPEDVLIAADGGTQHCKTLGLTPSLIVGDFDSVEAEELAIYQAKGVGTIQHPSYKDETDLELAIALAVERGLDELYIIGALGSRWDMTISNLLLLALPQFSRVNIHVVDGRQDIFLLHGGGNIELDGTPGTTISLIPLGGDARGISTHGLEYPLRNETLHFGSSRGVSNVFVEGHIQIELGQGILLCMLNKPSDS